MVEVILDPNFQRIFSKIKDASLKERIIKQIEKIKTLPDIGKPMMYGRKGTRELRVASFRLSYEYIQSSNTVYILDFYTKDEQ
jgi:mRNA-degrading endonuclease RelE of RelBE toxin-antitoxin system